MAQVAAPLRHHCPRAAPPIHHHLHRRGPAAAAVMAAAAAASSSSSVLALLSSIFTRSSSLLPPRPRHHLHRQKLFFSSTSLFARTVDSRAQGLGLPGTISPAEGGYSQEEDSDSDSDSPKKSRNEKKREARRAVRWGMELANFSPPQIKQILRVASLEQEVFEAIMLVKRLGPDVREGKRRQFNYIGRLLRKVQPELMDALILASKDGDNSKLQSLSGQEAWTAEDSYKEEEEIENVVEGCQKYIDIATRWFDGLIYKDSSITNEVYSIHNVEFDRQELRKLVRSVQSIEERQQVEDNEAENDVALTRAKKSLARFLHVLAEQSLAE